MARNGRTKVPNLFRKVPKKRIQAPRGRARRFSLRLACVSFMGFGFVGRVEPWANKKPTSLSAGGFGNLVRVTSFRFCTPTAAAASDVAIHLASPIRRIRTLAMRNAGLQLRLNNHSTAIL